MDTAWHARSGHARAALERSHQLSLPVTVGVAAGEECCVDEEDDAAAIADAT